MNSVPAIERRRETILKEMRALRSLCAASLSQQMLPVKHKGKEKPVMRGPCVVLSRSQDPRNET